MGKRTITLTIDSDYIDQLDKSVEVSEGKYTSRNHLIGEIIKEWLKKKHVEVQK